MACICFIEIDNLVTRARWAKTVYAINQGNGKLEYWNFGLLGFVDRDPILIFTVAFIIKSDQTPLFVPTSPSFQHSIIPIGDSSIYIAPNEGTQCLAHRPDALVILWKFNLDSKPARLTVFGPDFSAEGVSDAFADTQAQPAAAVGTASRSIHPIQPVK